MTEYTSAVVRFGTDVPAEKISDVESKCCLEFGVITGVAPILTIGIPVYNGGNSIVRTLSSVYESLEDLGDPGKVEVIVCDNASSDGTGDAICDFFSIRVARGAYYRHGLNVGFDSNLDSIMRLGKGSYVWFVGCGDEIKKDSVARLLGKLEGKKICNVLLDFDRYGEADGSIIQDREHGSKRDVLVKSRDDFSVPRYAPALSANVVNRLKWLDCLRYGFVSSGWGHVERILRVVGADSASETAILVQPFFTLFVDKSGWWTKPDGYKLHLEHIKIIRRMQEFGFGPNAVQTRLRELNGVVLIRSVIGAKKYGHVFDWGGLEEIRVCCSPVVFMIIRIGLKLPLRLASFLFSESQGKAIRLGSRKIYKRIFGDS